jgi:hypothetical protein
VGCGTAEPVPFVHQRNSKKPVVIETAADQRTNLILFGQALLKAINKLHRQKAN